MHNKIKKIGGHEYSYRVKSVRLPDGKVVSLEKRTGTESPQEMESFFREKEIQENYKYVLRHFGKDYIFDERALQSVEEAKVGYRLILRKLTPTSLKDLWNRFTANFTYESNALEGNSLTLKDVSLVMFENVALSHKDLREIYETKNSREVVELIQKNKFSLTQPDIIKMHKILVKDLGVQTGYKKFPNIILGKMMKTVPPEKVPAEMDKLLQWYEEKKLSIHPLKLAALFHGKFEQIHPFEDGNGRVGRFLINLILIKSKYPPLIIRRTQRISYLKALEAFDHNHNETLQRFILDKFKETYSKFFQIYIKYV